MPAVLATLLAFFLLVFGRKTAWISVLAGLVAAGAVALKGTTVLALLIFPVIALIVPPGPRFEGGSCVRRPSLPASRSPSSPA